MPQRRGQRADEAEAAEAAKPPKRQRQLPMFPYTTDALQRRERRAAEAAAAEAEFSLPKRAALAVEATRHMVPDYLQPVVTKEVNETTITFHCKGAVGLEFDDKDKVLEIDNFFYDVTTGVTAALREATKQPYDFESAGLDPADERTLPGLVMEWIRLLAIHMGALRITLEDVWRGYYKGALISSELFKDDYDMCVDRARRHAFAPDEIEGLVKSLQTNGYYGMWGFKYTEDVTPKGKNGRMAEISPVYPNCLVIRQAFVDMGGN